MSNYGMIGDCRLLNIKVVRDDEVIYLGKVEDAPEEIRKLSYFKVRVEIQLCFMCKKYIKHLVDL